MLMHFGMTGCLRYFRDVDKDPPHDRFLISFEDGYHLTLDDRRMFGKGDLVEDPDEFILEKKLGPDPWPLTPLPSGNASTFLLSHRREGEVCPRGNGEIRKTSAAGRTTYYCPPCQPEE
jgi:formamidopyrimidine-DNA glycosylase